MELYLEIENNVAPSHRQNGEWQVALSPHERHEGRKTRWWNPAQVPGAEEPPLMYENTKLASEGGYSGTISPTRVAQKAGSSFGGGTSGPSLKATPQRALLDWLWSKERPSQRKKCTINNELQSQQRSLFAQNHLLVEERRRSIGRFHPSNVPRDPQLLFWKNNRCYQSPWD